MQVKYTLTLNEQELLDVIAALRQRRLEAIELASACNNVGAWDNAMDIVSRAETLLAVLEGK